MQPLTNLDAVKSTFGQTALTDDVITQFIADATVQITIDNLPDVYQELATRYFACHLMFVAQQQSANSIENVTSVQAGPLKKTYGSYSGSKGVYNDRWEQLYQELKFNIQTAGVDAPVAKFM